MRTWLKWTGLAAFGLLASTALAADHTDGTNMGLGTDANPDADISDVYAWAPDANTVVLIMNIVGGFSDATQYAFHVGRTDAAGAAITAAPTAPTDVICEFDASENISCWVGDSEFVTGDASADAGITNDAGNVKVHAGEHADPFFFNVTGFGAAIGAALDAATAVGGLGTIDDAAGCPDLETPLWTAVEPGNCVGESVGDVLRGLLNGTYADTTCAAGPGANGNDFAGANVHSIVLEIDASLLGSTGDYLQVWGSTHQKN